MARRSVYPPPSGLAADLQRLSDQIEYPILRDAGAGVGRELPAAVVGEGGVGDLADEEGTAGVGIAVVAWAARDHGHIRFWLGVVVEAEGQLHPDRDPRAENGPQGVPD